MTLSNSENSTKTVTIANENNDGSTKPNESSKSDQTVAKAIEPVKVIRIGTRKSKLAMIQAEYVKSQLDEHYNTGNKKGYEFKLVPISTKGDKILDVPLANIGSKALFTKELEVALIDNGIDLIVHSCKDLPTNLPPGLCISAILRREIADDVLVVKKGLEDKFKSVSDFLKNHHNLFKDKAVGTSSLRRIAQLKRLNSDIKIEDIRGNIDTRLNKLDAPDSPYSALVLAGAGLRRAGLSDRITALLNENWWYAVSQGALAIECRENDAYTQGLLHKLIDDKTTFQVIAERSFMQYLEGGCSIPLGVRSEFVVENDKKLVEIKEASAGDVDEKTGVEVKKEEIKKENDKKSDKKENVQDEEKKLRDNVENKQEIEKANIEEIANLKVSGVVISLDGKKCVQFDCKLKDVDLKSIPDDKIDCTKIVLPTSQCPHQAKIKEQYVSCAKLGIHLAKQLQNLGAKSILDEINKNRKPLTE